MRDCRNIPRVAKIPILTMRLSTSLIKYPRDEENSRYRALGEHPRRLLRHPRRARGTQFSSLLVRAYFDGLTALVSYAAAGSQDSATDDDVSGFDSTERKRGSDFHGSRLPGNLFSGDCEPPPAISQLTPPFLDLSLFADKGERPGSKVIPLVIMSARWKSRESFPSRHFSRKNGKGFEKCVSMILNVLLSSANQQLKIWGKLLGKFLGWWMIVDSDYYGF